MAKKTHDLSVKIGEYEKDGETKGRYDSVGVVIQGENGPYIIMKRTFNPAGVPNPENRDTVIVSMFKSEKKEETKKDSGWED